MPKLDLVEVSKNFGNIQALNDISLHVDDKEYVCIIGPSGCGKSTLIRCVAGIEKPSSGEILIDGQSVKRTLIEDRQIGYVFQDIALFPHLTVQDNLAYGLAVRRTPSDEVRTVTNEMLDLINMRDRSKSYPMELSGGAQQKVAVGRAIATGAHLFLLDEPLGALDAIVRAELRYELRKLSSDLGLTVIHVTHDQEEALSIADRIVIMKSGRIVEVGKPSEIYHSPKTLFTANFVGETNLLEGRISRTGSTGCTVDIGGHEFSAPTFGKAVGQKVVVFIRPEFVQLTTQTEYGWKGRVKQVAFLGCLNRYVIETDNGIDIIAEVSTAEYSMSLGVGESVSLSFDNANITAFDYPQDGVEKEISLE